MGVSWITTQKTVRACKYKNSRIFGKFLKEKKHIFITRNDNQILNVPEQKYFSLTFTIIFRFFTIDLSDTFLSDYLTDLKLHSTK